MAIFWEMKNLLKFGKWLEGEALAVLFSETEKYVKTTAVYEHGVIKAECIKT